MPKTTKKKVPVMRVLDHLVQTMSPYEMGEPKAPRPRPRRSRPTVKLVELIAALNVPEPVRLATILALELRDCELDDEKIGRVACLACARVVTSEELLVQFVLGFLLVEHVVLSELRVIMVETATRKAYKRWRSDAERS